MTAKNGTGKITTANNIDGTFERDLGLEHSCNTLEVPRCTYHVSVWSELSLHATGKKDHIMIPELGNFYFVLKTKMGRTLYWHVKDTSV